MSPDQRVPSPQLYFHARKASEKSPDGMQAVFERIYARSQPCSASKLEKMCEYRFELLAS